MSRNGAILTVFVLVIVTSSLVSPVVAGRQSTTLSWDCGLKVAVFIENNDFWTTGVTSEIFITLTLADVGGVVEFYDLTFQLILLTERVDIALMIIMNPWDSAGDTLNLVGRFNVTADMVNNAGWDVYMGHFYYQFNQTVRLYDDQVLVLYTHEYGPSTLNISTFWFIVLWPFPVIILMLFIYFFALLGLKKFNRRYIGDFVTRSEQLEHEIMQESSRRRPSSDA